MSQRPPASKPDKAENEEDPFADVTSLAYTIAPQKHDSILVPINSNDKGTKGMGKY